MITCAGCQREVIPTKAFRWEWFLLWLLVGGIGGICYLLYFMGKSPRECPMCGVDVYMGGPSQTYAKAFQNFYDDDR